MTSGRAGKGMGSGINHGSQTVPSDEDRGALEPDDVKGSNRMEGDAQSRVRNQRHAVPGEQEPDSSIEETFAKMDPKVRAGRSDD